MLLVLLLSACGSSEPTPAAPVAERGTPPAAGEQELLERSAAPRIESFTFKPAEPTADDRLSVRVRASAPGSVDPLDIDLVWFVNGQRLLDEVAETLGDGIVKKGDTVFVEATASDRDRETTERSQTIEIANSPPRFLSDPREISDLDGFVIVATDTDGDALSWSVEGGPPGLSIDPSRGVLAYRGDPNDEGGDFDVVATADDGDDGVARWTFRVSVAPGSAVAQADEPPAERVSEPAATGLPAGTSAASTTDDGVSSHKARDDVHERQARDEVEEYAPRGQAREPTVTDEASSFEPGDDGG